MSDWLWTIYERVAAVIDVRLKTHFLTPWSDWKEDQVPKQLQQSVYLVLQAEYGRYTHNKDVVVGFTVCQMLKSRPPGAVGPVIKVNLSLPDLVFKPLACELELEIPREAVDYQPSVRVAVEDLKDIHSRLTAS